MVHPRGHRTAGGRPRRPTRLPSYREMLLDLKKSIERQRKARKGAE